MMELRPLESSTLIKLQEFQGLTPNEIINESKDSIRYYFRFGILLLIVYLTLLVFIMVVTKVGTFSHLLWIATVSLFIGVTILSCLSSIILGLQTRYTLLLYDKGLIIKEEKGRFVNRVLIKDTKGNRKYIVKGTTYVDSYILPNVNKTGQIYIDERYIGDYDKYIEIVSKLTNCLNTTEQMSIVTTE